jgi:hypothetical protein
VELPAFARRNSKGQDAPGNDRTKAKGQGVKYSIAIPSYRRAELLKNNTLVMLERMKADRDSIHVFVATEEEAETYRAVIGADYRIIVGVRGICHQRKFYHNWFPKGERIISLDDDIAEVMERAETKVIPARCTFDQIAETGFGYAEKEKARLWGINPVMNNFFLSDSITVGLRFICGIFMGSYAGDWVFCDESRQMEQFGGEDHHNTMRSFTRYGSVVRLEYLCPKTRYLAKGGVEASVKETGMERKANHSRELLWVHSQYPHVTSVTTKADGYTNLKLKPITYGRHPRPSAA